jgi:hypothetical protein
MTNKQLSDLKDSAKQYCDAEKKIIQAELDFIDKVIKTRGKNSINNKNIAKVEEILVKSLTDFLTK